MARAIWNGLFSIENDWGKLTKEIEERNYRQLKRKL